jgi:hypothetical protein
LWFKDSEVTTDFAKQEIIDLTLTRNRTGPVVDEIDVEAVLGTIAQKLATLGAVGNPWSEGDARDLDASWR